MTVPVSQKLRPESNATLLAGVSAVMLARHLSVPTCSAAHTPAGPAGVSSELAGCAGDSSQTEAELME